MSDRDEIPRYLENWQDEVDSAVEYRAMAAAEADPRLAKVYTNLAAMEEDHIAFWEDRLRKAGASVPRRLPSWRSRVLGGIARSAGTRCGQRCWAPTMGCARTSASSWAWPAPRSIATVFSSPGWRVSWRVPARWPWASGCR